LFLVGRSVDGNMEGDVLPDVFLSYLIELNGQGRFPFERLITVFHSLANINEAVAALWQQSMVKAVVAVGSQ
jgi:aryl-alcohol dehydrogenase